MQAIEPDIHYTCPVTQIYHGDYTICKESVGWSFSHREADTTDENDLRQGWCLTPSDCYNRIDELEE